VGASGWVGMPRHAKSDLKHLILMIVRSEFSVRAPKHYRRYRVRRPLSVRLNDGQMTIIRRIHNSRFTIVPNAIFNDEHLSIEAKGLLGWLLARHPTWHVKLDHVGSSINVGRRRLQRIFRELIEVGYITRERQRRRKGQRFGEIQYVVRDVPGPAKMSSKPPAPRVRNSPTAPLMMANNSVQRRTSHRGSEKDPYNKNYTNNSEASSNLGSAVATGEAKKKPVPVGRSDDGAVQLQIANLIGDRGWEVLMAMQADEVEVLVNTFRRGLLDEADIHALRARSFRIDDPTRVKVES
jgi:hypothetical protein